MAGSVKLFQFFQRIHQIIGVSPSHPIRKDQETILCLTRTIVLLCCAQIVLTLAAFLAFESKSMFDFVFAFYVLITLINGMVIYSVFIWESENTLKFIESSEGFIEKSKFCTVLILVLCEKVLNMFAKRNKNVPYPYFQGNYY